MIAVVKHSAVIGTDDNSKHIPLLKGSKFPIVEKRSNCTLVELNEKIIGIKNDCFYELFEEKDDAS